MPTPRAVGQRHSMMFPQLLAWPHRPGSTFAPVWGGTRRVRQQAGAPSFWEAAGSWPSPPGNADDGLHHPWHWVGVQCWDESDISRLKHRCCHCDLGRMSSAVSKPRFPHL